MTRRVMSTSRSSVMSRGASGIAGIDSGVPSESVVAMRSTIDGTRSSRALTSALVRPLRSATASITALSKSAQPRMWATRAATSEPPAPYIRDTVTNGTLGSAPRARYFLPAHLLHHRDPRRGPRRAGAAAGHVVESHLTEAAVTAPAPRPPQERLEHTAAARARPHIDGRHVAVAVGMQQR